jgi:hypothetical protein
MSPNPSTPSPSLINSLELHFGGLEQFKTRVSMAAWLPRVYARVALGSCRCQCTLTRHVAAVVIARVRVSAV